MKSISLSICAVIAFAYTLWSTDHADLEKDLEALQARVQAIEDQLSDPIASKEATSLSELAEEGKAKFNTICTACHKNSFTEPMLAPPMAMVKDHYGQFFKDDIAGFVSAVVEWVKNPTPEKTMMPGAIRNFKIMPLLPLPDEDLEAIATYLFEADIPTPGNFREHMLQERKELQKGVH
ncbi:MAG: hypothetical protein P8L44_19420 [Opitutales bacterium]|jgi:mono/diheme cytochrome c family protein|nr:hypothetical protein [Opitutales bacterium]